MSAVQQISPAILDTAPLNIHAVQARYYGIFLTFRCIHACSFCVHRFHEQTLEGFREIDGHEWLAFFRDLDTHGVPVTLRGGEPGLHPDFAEIVKGLAERHTVHIVSNLAFDIPAFLNRNINGTIAIVANYRPGSLFPGEFAQRACALREAGYTLEIRGFATSTADPDIRDLEEYCSAEGLEFRRLPFLDWYQDRFYGGELSAFNDESATLEERTTPAWLLFAPDGSIYHSHHRLYERSPAMGHVSHPWMAYPLSEPATDFCGARRTDLLPA